MKWIKIKRISQIDGIETVVDLSCSPHQNFYVNNILVHNCSFCSVTRVHEFACGRRVKPAFLSGKQIKILLSKIANQLPETNVIYFVEDSILPTISRLDDFCGALDEFKSKFRYMVQTETDKTSREVVKKLANAGVFHISFGVENCSPRIRKLMHKPQNEERIENIITWCNEFGVRCYYLIILFSPESTMDDLMINYQTLNRWIADNHVMVSVEPFMMPYRGASIYYEDYPMDYKITTLSNGKVLKHPYIIYPKDEQVRELMMKFKELMPVYLDDMNKEEGHQHKSKDYTGKIYVQLLGDILREKGYL